MELYTLISRAIGIFGATYAALNALRTNVEPHLKTAADTADNRLTAITKVVGAEQPEMAPSKAHCKSIKDANFRWKWANIIPAILFFLFIYMVGFSVLVAWGDVVVKHDDTSLAALYLKCPWCYFRPALWILAVTDFVCVVVAFCAWLKCHSADRSLQEHFNLMKSKGLEAFTNPAIETAGAG
jgi:hypothetical protein